MDCAQYEMEQKSSIWDSDSDGASKRREKVRRRPRGGKKSIYMDPKEVRACRELGFELEDHDDDDDDDGHHDHDHDLDEETKEYHSGNKGKENYHLPLARIITNRSFLLRQYSSTSTSTSDNSPIQNWRISSPGDDPRDVKARLKVWAQAVALESTSQLQH